MAGIWRASIGFVLAVALASCGFSPLYGSNGASEGIEHQFAATEIAPLEGRQGQQVTNALYERLHSAGSSAEAAYQLVLVLEESVDRFGIQQDGSASREAYLLSASFRLLDNASGSVLTQGQVNARSTYDVMPSDFANVAAIEDARSRAAVEIARGVSLRLATFFKTMD